MGKEDYKEYIKWFKGKDESKRRIALSRLISIVENEPEKAEYVFNKLPKGDAYIIGITGPPGSGKSTLVGALGEKLIEKGKSLGVLSIDPSSPYTGGSFLGDRLRMSKISSNPKVFIRSMASRGSLGGLSRAAFDVVSLFSAFGKDYVIVETVGSGQSDVEIQGLAYTILVLNVPGLGDGIQATKAGILEIGDILVVNKKDFHGADVIATQLDVMLDDAIQYMGSTAWRPPVVKTNSLTGEGADELIEEIENHREHIELSEILEKKKEDMAKKRIINGVKDLACKFVDSEIDNMELEKSIKDIYKGKKNIYSVVKKFYKSIFSKKSKK